MDIDSSGVNPSAPTGDTRTAVVVSALNASRTASAQEQILLPCISSSTAGAKALSAGTVLMPAGKFSRVHYHAVSEIIVVCLTGNAASLIGPTLEPRFHGPGEFIYIPPGVFHAGVNLSRVEGIVGVEARTDPAFNDDVVTVPELDELAAVRSAELQDLFENGKLPMNNAFRASDGSLPGWPQPTA